MKITGILRGSCTEGETCQRIIDTDGPDLVFIGPEVTDPAVVGQLPSMASHERAVTLSRTLAPELRPTLDVSGLRAAIKRLFTVDLFRLETLDHYDVASDDNDFHRYVRGEPAPDREGHQAWLDQLTAERAAGKTRRRVHALREPLGDYLRYECEWGYLRNAAAGEDIRILDLDATGIDLRGVGDFFVADHEQVIVSRYTPGGEFDHSQLVSDGAPYRALADILWSAAQPFGPWWVSRPQYHRDRK